MSRLKKIGIFVVCVFIVSCSRKPINKTNNVKDIQSTTVPSQTPLGKNEDIHNKYIDEMKKEENSLNLFSNGRFLRNYSFFDVDKDGIDELIISGGYYGYSIYTYCEGELILLGVNKYGGGSIKIYPNDGIIFWKGGHSDQYFEEYIKISGDIAVLIAEKSWEVKLSDKPQKKINQKFKIKGKSVDELEFKKYIKEIKNKKVFTHKELEWHN